MNQKEAINVLYFLGIGGIGMSALARYFHRSGAQVCGYDRTQTPLTTALELEGIPVSYTDRVNELPLLLHVTPKEHVWVVYTPAIPSNAALFTWFQDEGYTLIKRSDVLGRLTAGKPTIAVAGTHGKTSTSALIAHLLTFSGIGCNAFVGGIMTNYNTNHLYKGQNAWNVIEADEFDRSFMKLNPDISIITSTDADHLDIYSNHHELLNAFTDYASKTKAEGSLIVNEKAEVNHAKSERYGFSPNNHWRISTTRQPDGDTCFHLHTHDGAQWNDLPAPMPGEHNLENAAAAAIAAIKVGIDQQALREALKSFKGIKRRFEYHHKSERCIYIDDYAHHPEELRAVISAVRNTHQNKRVTGIFQPHLFSRTRDFGDGFARSLEMLDEVWLLEIYPAREQAIPGIDSQWLLDKIQTPHKRLVEKSQLLPLITERLPEILLTLGAGDIDREVEPIRQTLQTLMP